MQKYYLSLASDNFLLDECETLSRANYLAWSYSNRWEEAVVITLVIDGHEEDIAIVEPDGMF